MTQDASPQVRRSGTIAPCNANGEKEHRRAVERSLVSRALSLARSDHPFGGAPAAKTEMQMEINCDWRLLIIALRL